MAEIKICGLVRREDIDYANTLMPDFVGFVFAKSRRMVTLDQAKRLIEPLDKRIGAVGVFVGSKISVVAGAAVECGLKAVQLHGFEDAEYINELRAVLPKECEIWKAASVKSQEDIKNALQKNVDRLVLDAFSPDARGGTGKRFNWSLIEKAEIDRPFFVAGGINAGNIRAALDAAAKSGVSFGIDVSSGAETDGCKDFTKMAEIINAVRKYGKGEAL